MEKLPMGERPEPRIVGRGSQEAKEKERKEIMSAFGEGHIAQFSEEDVRELATAEREKTSLEVEAITASNKVTNQLLEKFGARPFDIPERNIHFVNEDAWKKSGGSDIGVMNSSPLLQAVFVRNHAIENRSEISSDNVLMATSLFHEFLHLKGYTALEVESDKKRGVYRFGWDVEATYRKSGQSGYTRWFRGIHEAVVSEMEKKYSHDVLMDIPSLKDEAEWLNSPKAQLYKETIKKNHDVDPEDVAWLSRDGKSYHAFAYKKHRRVLDYVVDAIYEDDKEGASASRDETMTLLFKAQFDGRLLNVARKVDAAFGKKSFRLLGEMDETNPSAGRVLDELMRRRRKIETRKTRRENFIKQNATEEEREAYEAAKRDFEPRKEYARPEFRLNFELDLSEGAKLMAHEDESGIASIVIEKNGEKLFDVADLAPEGTIFVTPRYARDHEDKLIRKYAASGKWQYHRDKKLVFVGDMRDAKSLIGLFHEMGHAWVFDTRGESLEKLEKQSKKGMSRAERFKREALLKSQNERGASAGALRVIRYVRDRYGVNFLETFGGPEEARKVIYNALLSHRFGSQYFAHESDQLTDEDAKILEVLFDQSKFKTEKPEGFAERKLKARDELKNIMRKAAEEEEIQEGSNY